MGLAPYGNPGVKLDEFISLNHESYQVNAPLLFERSNGTSAIAKRLGPERTPESEIDDSFKNIAFAVQDACEIAMLALVKLALQKTNCRNVCLAGGVALNSKANGKIQASGMVDNIFVQPAASDDGVALGAVLAPYLDKGGRLPMKPMRHAYLGPEFSDAEIEKALRTYKLRATKLDNVAATAGRNARQRENSRLVSGTHGIRPARAGRPLDPGRSARSGNECQGEQRRQIPRMVASVCAFDVEGSRRRVSRARLRFAVHDPHQSGEAGETRASFPRSRTWMAARVRKRSKKKSIRCTGT